MRVLEAFRRARVSEEDFTASTGYGYNDTGREKLEGLYASVFGGEMALVRPQLVSGTHAISCCLFGALRPGQKILAVTGPPYDTLQKVIGGPGQRGTLQDFDIGFDNVNVIEPVLARDRQGVLSALKPFLPDERVRLLYLQRSRGYSLRPALTMEDLHFLLPLLKEANPRAVLFVDNCYGEFVEEEEPLMAGADLIAGSLIKNPGGGLAPSGGYVVGTGNLVEQAAGRLTAPGLGRELGPTLGTNRLLIQGLFLAPHFVGEALKGALFAACLFESLGFEVRPRVQEPRGDIVQAILLKEPDLLQEFCRLIQAYSPVDSHALPVPGPVPGYQREIIMAAGTFVQGSSLELSADAPLDPPYAVYLQGGLSYPHTRAALTAAAAALQAKKRLPPL